ncbi:MAG: permease [Bacillota bacterium]
MKKITKLKPFILLILVIQVNAVLLITRPELALSVVQNTVGHFAHMFYVLPPIFVLMGLLDVWVPRETVTKNFGENTGVKGALLVIFLGIAAAGPLYAAFPVAGMMIKKGASFSNIIIFLGAWSTMKVPMFLFEVTSLGLTFAATRWLLSLAGILIMAWLINRLISREEKRLIYQTHTG